MVVAAAKPDVNTDMTFLHEDNLCGSTLLNLVSSGHSILADIRILSERVPTAFFAAASLDKDRGDVRSGSKREGSKRASSTSDGLFLNIFGHSSSSSSGAAVDQSTASDDGNNSSNNDMQESKKYAPFLFDFSYLNNPEEFEQSLALPSSSTSNEDAGEPSAENLLELEREFAINHRQSIEEYYDLFYSIYKYQKELNQFVDDLSKGYYIQYTIESVLLDKDGRQLLCEGVWLYGVILIHMEHLLPVRKEGEVDIGDVLSYASSKLITSVPHVNIIFTGLYSRTTYHCILPFVWEGWGYVSL